jgi:DNA replication and repair protein RecF
MALTRLSLTDFRNHHAASFRPSRQFVVLHGANGAGKTNILEAVSLLVPGRGLRRAALSEMVRTGGNGGFSIAAEIEYISLGTGVEAHAPERRKVRINGANATVNALAEWLCMVWLTPSMDRLFADGAGGRRRFVDRLVLALNPGHAMHSGRYELAMRQRNKLITGDGPLDETWLDAIETQMAENAVIINQSRDVMVQQLSLRLESIGAGVFAVPKITSQGATMQSAEEMKSAWKTGRKRDAAAGRTLAGPHRYDLVFYHSETGQSAERCSTGEQKALLLSTILTHAELVAELRNHAPLILLDEVAAHLDPSRRAALYERLALIGGQVWMTGTEAHLFDGIGGNGQFIEVSAGKLHL